MMVIMVMKGESALLDLRCEKWDLTQGSPGDWSKTHPVTFVNKRKNTTSTIDFVNIFKHDLTLIQLKFCGIAS
jgi:hypothetical protein